MKNIEKRLDELYQYVEEMDLRCKADNLKRYELQERIDKAIELLYKRKHVENLFGGVEKSNTDKIIDILKGDSDE